MPASYIAALLSRVTAIAFGQPSPNIFVDLTLLFIFGLAQYVLLAYILGWIFGRLFKLSRASA
jgi:predicted Na+-dependent transporter